MATMAHPRRDDDRELRPNIPTASNRLPGVRDYEQVDRDAGQPVACGRDVGAAQVIRARLGHGRHGQAPTGDG